VRLIDPESGALLHLLCRTPDVMLSVAFDSNGNRLAAAGADNSIRIFNVTNGLEELVIEQHSDWVMDVGFSSDGNYVASASRDKTARVFDSRSGEQEAGYQEHDSPVLAVAFDHDGQKLFSRPSHSSVIASTAEPLP
jgi:WD40 repeat protein